ncbi:hypothetical protein COEREDRAFT_49360, partial [Coemansia reversa NRRL 1564]
MHQKLNNEQLGIYSQIVLAVEVGQVATLLVDGHAGHEKTFVVNAVLSTLCGCGMIVLPCATTVLAAQNYRGSCTAHSLFHIPIERDKLGLRCNVVAGTDRAELLSKTSLIVWDELPMANRAVVEAVDIMLCELCGIDQPFGGKVFVGIGGFRQVAPVVPGVGHLQTILESLKALPLWRSFNVLDL